MFQSGPSSRSNCVSNVHGIVESGNLSQYNGVHVRDQRATESGREAQVANVVDCHFNGYFDNCVLVSLRLFPLKRPSSREGMFAGIFLLLRLGWPQY